MQKENRGDGLTILNKLTTSDWKRIDQAGENRAQSEIHWVSMRSCLFLENIYLNHKNLCILLNCSNLYHHYYIGRDRDVYLGY